HVYLSQCVQCGRIRDCIDRICHQWDNLSADWVRIHSRVAGLNQETGVQDNGCGGYRNWTCYHGNILLMKDWRTWAIVVLAAVLVFASAAWSSPSAEERVKAYQQVIEQQEHVIDSLQSILLSTADSLLILKDLQKIDRSEFDKKLSRLRKQ